MVETIQVGDVIQVGDIVRITSIGGIYSTYGEMASHMKLKNWVSGAIPSDTDCLFEVVGVSKHLNPSEYDTVLAIRNSRNEEYLMSIERVEKVNTSPRTTRNIPIVIGGCIRYIDESLFSVIGENSSYTSSESDDENDHTTLSAIDAIIEWSGFTLPELIGVKIGDPSTSNEDLLEIISDIKEMLRHAKRKLIENIQAE